MIGIGYNSKMGFWDVMICIVFFVLIFGLFFQGGCRNEYVQEHERLLSGKHELRKFNVKSTKNSESSGSWFLVIGSYSSKTTEESKIRFYFKTIDDEYVFKEMDFNKVNIKIDSLATIPYVKFYWKYCGASTTGNSIYESAITRAVIHCREEDFQPEININDLQ